METRSKSVNLQLSIVLGLLIATAPCSANISVFSFSFTLQTAFAKNGNNGNSGGNGNGGGNSNKGGNSETPGNSNSQGAKDKGVTTKGSATALSVRHNDGISEVVRNGRYIMKDSKGRTIVNRRASLRDEIRLRFFRK
ncbi:hypothetical protein P6U16_25070 (plasmid) [Rhizobium sp. 32-5/1]|uniref:hypothetical protein n=1 Tax=Rhizobium sp. 32-5/1 TaxID=3019602 RepID=UPI00240CFC23|nr:hypothetical protein [Rhizobium sp. 32-5/1]WEZ85394.1 hypothetical protein P6U16_25070 [Rhizobium sp. 32-5/1]